MRPPWFSTIVYVIERPSPVPWPGSLAGGHADRAGTALAVLGHRLRRVREEVQDHLLQAVLIAQHVRKRGAQVAVHFHALQLEVVFHQLQRPLDHVVQVDGRALRRLLAGKGQEVPHDPAGALRLLVNHLEVAAVFLRDLLLLEQELGETGDRRERIVQLVRHTRHELSDGGELLALNELGLHGLLVGHVLDQHDDALIARRARDAGGVHAHRSAQALGARDERRGAVAAARRLEESHQRV